MLLSDAIRKRTARQAPTTPQRAAPAAPVVPVLPPPPAHRAPVEQLVTFLHRTVPKGFTTSPLFFLREEFEDSDYPYEIELLKERIDPFSTGRAVAGSGLFHVTTNLPAVLADGRLRSAREMKAANIGFAGLGSWADDAQDVSVGVMRDGAIRVLKAMQLMADAVHGRIDGERALAAMNEVLEPSMVVVNYYAERLMAGEGRAKLKRIRSEHARDPRNPSPYTEVSEYNKRQHELAQAVRKAKPGLALYDALLEYEGIVLQRIEDGIAGDTESEISVCASPVLFTKSSTQFASVNPNNIGLLQLAARKTAKIVDVKSDECELRFDPDDLVIIGVWQASQHKSMPSRSRRSTVR